MKVRINVLPATDVNNEHQILLEGYLTSANIEYIKSTVLEALQQHQNIKIQLQNVEKLDLSIVQILYAFRRAAKTENKSISIEMDLPHEFQIAVKQSGLDQKFNYMAS
jgi:ABC-type transporter Mla MlaB component